MVTLIQLPITSEAKGIFFSYSSATKLASDLEFLKKSTDNQIEQLKEYRKITEDYKKANNLQNSQITLLKTDKQILKEGIGKYQESYTKCTEDLNKEIESKPSRFTWFGIGFLTAVVLSFTGLILTK
jgi:hypothetical protein